MVDIHELLNATHKAQADARSVRRLVKLAIALCLLLGMQLAATFGLVYGVVAITKDTKVSSDTGAVLVTKGNVPISTGAVVVENPAGTEGLPASFSAVVLTTPGGFDVTANVEGYIAVPGQNSAAVLFTPLGRVLYFQGTVMAYDDSLDALALSVTTPAAAFIAQQLGGGARMPDANVSGVSLSTVTSQPQTRRPKGSPKVTTDG